MGRFDGKTAVVTGFGSGIGQAAAVLLAAEGASVVGLSRNVEAGEATLAAIREAGGVGTFVSTDIRFSEEVDRAFVVLKPDPENGVALGIIFQWR